MDKDLPTELAARVKFADVVKRMEKISNVQTQGEKAQFLTKFFNSIFELQKKFHDEEGANANASFYPFLRLFLPKLDLERGSFGIKTTTLGRLFVKALAISATSEAGVKLTKFEGVTTDFGEIVYDVMKTRSPETGTLTVFEINKYLDLIADHFKQNERNKIDAEMIRMMNEMSAIDRKWLTRILLKHLRLGLGAKRIMELYNPNAWQLYNQHSHLSRVCDIIESKTPIDMQNGLIEIFKPIRPMLCERGYVSAINQMLANHTFYLETKMDGERCQLHVNGTQFKYFSRNCMDELTNKFGDSSTTGIYSPFLYKQLDGKVDSAIFDGEMMVWDSEEEVFLKKEKGALLFCKRELLRDADHFLECLNNAFDANEEGVVIKREESKYRPGKREKGGWFKMKPDYENNLINDFDLLIIGGFYNIKKTFVESFLLAVLKQGVTENESVFYAVCKIRNGFKRSQMREIHERLKPFIRPVNIIRNGRTKTYESPVGIEWARAEPDFCVDPKQSIVLQIKASELVESTRYRTSHSFRFPRLMQIRWDKAWYDTCSLSEFQIFCTSSSRAPRLTKRHATTDDLNNSPRTKRQREKKFTAPSSVMINEIQPVDKICEGRDFCILNGVKNSHSVEEMENMVRRHGGRIVKYPNKNTFVIISGEPKTLRVKKFIESKLYNIATPEWLTRAVGSDETLTELIAFTPSDMVFATDQLQTQFNAELDGVSAELEDDCVEIIESQQSICDLTES